jgi:hypothetical protein
MGNGIYWNSDVRNYRMKDFEIEAFINEIEALPKLKAKLEKFNEYYDLIQRKTTEVLTNDNERLIFTLLCSTCEGRWKGEGYAHNENNKKEIRQFIYEKAQEEAQKFEIMTYEKRVQKKFGIKYQ